MNKGKLSARIVTIIQKESNWCYFCPYTSTAKFASPTSETSRPQENLEDAAKWGQVAILKKAENKEDINGSPSDSKSKNYAATEGRPVAHHVIETTCVMSDTVKFTERQPEKEDEAVVQYTVKEPSNSSRESAMSVSMLSPAECWLTQELRESKRDSTRVQHDRSDQNFQSGKLKEMHHEVSIEIINQATPLPKTNVRV